MRDKDVSTLSVQVGEDTQGEEMKRDEFYRAMYCPEVDEERRDADWSWRTAQHELNRVKPVAQRFEEIFRIDRAFDYGAPRRRLCIDISDAEIGSMSGGGAKKFADYIAERLVRDVVRHGMVGK